jgi:erythromycin esterase-like protein
MFANAVLHANEKTIVWTATVHAAKRQGSRSDKPVGALYAERWDDHVAAIGFTALGGESSRAGRPPAPLDPMPADSLEARVLGEDANVVFVDAARLRALGSLSSRLFGKPQPEDWSQYFDAVVVVRTEQAPTFEAPSGK